MAQTYHISKIGILDYFLIRCLSIIKLFKHPNIVSISERPSIHQTYTSFKKIVSVIICNSMTHKITIPNTTKLTSRNLNI